MQQNKEQWHSDLQCHIPEQGALNKKGGIKKEKQLSIIIHYTVKNIIRAGLGGSCL
jgi:hypothetical protein